MKVIISQLAEEDLVDIFDWIAQSNPDAAEHFRAEVERALALLGQQPEIGPHPGWKSRHSQLRFWVISRFHNFLIFYEARKDAVQILRVLDGRRQVRRIIEHGPGFV